ncbi:hypothetical protein LZD49_18900 [Dyadobacter sp. CY261]|uniref:lipocalin family protein n=1 Tax=Dyadobacter sp. CY261 TaxID=2907203 RepID=UPI001F28DA86|nr:lipocalin family protein [Dyadobacter sp. CY261]MCF0072556.1 hypothetical protein [Dyadobacter sp. CY261]
MKKAYALSKTSLLALLLILSVVFACSDDKDDDTKPVDTNPIAATWELEAITPQTPGTTIPNLALIEAAVPCLYDLKVTFKSDNTTSTADCPTAVTAIETFVPITGATWKVDGDNLILTKASTNQSFKFTQTATELKINVSVPASGTTPAVNAVLNFKKV